MDNSEDFNFEKGLSDIFQMNGQIDNYSLKHNDNFDLDFNTFENGNTDEERKNHQTGLTFRNNDEIARSVSEYANYSSIAGTFPIINGAEKNTKQLIIEGRNTFKSPVSKQAKASENDRKEK